MAGTNNTDTETPLTPATASDICRRIGLGMTRGKKMDSLKAGSWLLKVAEFIAAQQQEIERLQGEGESLKFRLHRMRDCRNCKSLGQCDNCDTGTLSGWEDGTRESENANGG